MAMITCKDCGNEISKKAKTCPSCGAPRGPKQYSLGKLIVLVVFGFFIYSIFSTDNTTRRPTAQPASAAPVSAISISSSDAGKPWSGPNWPFTVSNGTLTCAADAVTFSANGRIYAVNGFASSRGYADIGPIWRDNASLPGTKINIGAVLDPGLKLCR